MEEVWRDVFGYEGRYQVSNLGRVKSLDRFVPFGTRKRLVKGVIMKQYLLPNGYLFVMLSKNSVYKNKLVHILVAEAFLPNPENLPEVNHKDENRANDVVTNLEWCSHIYNCNYGTRSYKISKKLTNCKTTSKRVGQYTKEGILLNVFKSTKEVQRVLGIANQHISKACLGKRKTAYGYIWKYL